LDRVALPISGDNPKAKEIVAQLIDRIEFDSVDAGTIATDREKVSKAYHAASDADYQTQIEAFRSLFTER
jgi:predicted dinucleotide-binding enzyme